MKIILALLILSFSNLLHADGLKTQCRILLETIDTGEVATESTLARALQGLDPANSNVVMFAVKTDQLKPTIQNYFLQFAHGLGINLLTGLTESEGLGLSHRLFVFTAVGSAQNIKTFFDQLQLVYKVNWIKPLVVESKKQALKIAASPSYIEAVIQSTLNHKQSNFISISHLNQGLALPKVDVAILKTDQPIALALNVFGNFQLLDLEKNFRNVFNTPLSLKAKKQFGFLNAKDGQYDARLVHVHQSKITESVLQSYSGQMIVVTDDEGRAHTLLFPHSAEKSPVKIEQDIQGPGPSLRLIQFKSEQIHNQILNAFKQGPQYFIVKRYSQNFGLIFSIKAISTAPVELIQKIYFETFGVRMADHVTNSLIQYKNIGEKANIPRYVFSLKDLSALNEISQVVDQHQQPLYFVLKALSPLNIANTVNTYRSLFTDYKKGKLKVSRFHQAMTLFSNLSQDQLKTVLTDLESAARDWMIYITTHSPRPDPWDQKMGQTLTALASLTFENLKIPKPTTLGALKTFSATAQMRIEQKTVEESEKPKVLESLRLLSFWNDKRIFKIVSAETRARALKILEITADDQTNEIQFLLRLIAQKMVAAIGS